MSVIYMSMQYLVSDFFITMCLLVAISLQSQNDEML